MAYLLLHQNLRHFSPSSHRLLYRYFSNTMLPNPVRYSSSSSSAFLTSTSLHTSKRSSSSSSSFSSLSTCYHRRTLMTSTMNKPTLRPNIAIVGGGHAGLSTALRLASLPWTRLTKPRITLIDRSDRFVFLPMLYEFSMSQVAQWEIAPKFSDLLSGTDIKFIQANVENLDLSSGAIEGSDARTKQDVRILFDKAVLSVGAQVANLEKVAGAQEHAMPFYTMLDAIRLKERLLTDLDNDGAQKNIVVVGGGFSGVELAACIADTYGNKVSVQLIETSDTLLSRGTKHNRETSINALSNSNVSILYNSRVTNITSENISVSTSTSTSTSSTDYPADLVLWTAGNTASKIQQCFGLQLDKKGRIETDDYLQVIDHEGILYALGDGAFSKNNQNDYYGTAQVAVQQAEYVAWNTWANITGKRALKYRYTHLGEMMVLGKNNGTVSTALGVELDGTTAWTARRLAYLARMPTDKHRRLVAASWAVNPLLEGLGDLVKASQQYRHENL